jgi:hypothetical protein
MQRYEDTTAFEQLRMRGLILADPASHKVLFKSLARQGKKFLSRRFVQYWW